MHVFSLCYVNICNCERISYLNVLPSILRCFHLKVILHGFVHFAWMFACVFHLNVIFKINQGPPQPPLYFEPLPC